MENVSEGPLDKSTASLIQACAKDGIALLGLSKKAGEPAAVVEAIDAFVYAWQKGKRPPKKKLDPDDAPYMMGSLWGEQLVKRFGWEWRMITFHDHGDSVAPGVCAPDRSLVVYPIHFLMGCFQDPDVDATVALSFNMLDAGGITGVPSKGYANLMDGVHRIVPRA